MPPKLASTSETTGLKCPPEIGPNIRMIAKRPAAVAAAFSKSCRPVSPGDRFAAAIPEPITTAARNAEPRNSASRRRGSGAWCKLGRAPRGQAGDQLIDTGRDLVADPPHRLQILAGWVLELPVLVALAGKDRAGVAAAHRDHHVRLAHHVRL